MAESKKHASDPADEPFVIARTLQAPRDLVFDVWTTPERLIHWWGPKGFTVKSAKVDLRPGGLFHYCLKSPDGVEMWGRFLFREIVRPERLEFISSFSDNRAGITRHPMAPNWPLEMLNVVTFEEQGSQTMMTMKISAYNASAAERAVFKAGHTSMNQGWGGTLDQLTDYLLKVQVSKLQ